MNSPATALSAQNPNPLLAILWGGLLCGVLDITAALVVYGYMGAAASAAARHRCRTARPPHLWRRDRDGFAGSSVSFRDRVFSRSSLRHSEPPGTFSSPARCPLRRAVRHSRVFLHEPRRRASLSSREVSVLAEDDGHRHRYPYILCGPADRAGCPPICSLGVASTPGVFGKE